MVSPPIPSQVTEGVYRRVIPMSPPFISADDEESPQLLIPALPRFFSRKAGSE
jgi:hypothetical protein